MNGVCARIRDEERVTSECDTLRIAESVEHALHDHAALIVSKSTDEDASVATVGDGDARIVHGNLARIAKRATRERWRIGREHEWIRGSSSIHLMLCQHALDKGKEVLGAELTSVHAYDITARIHGDERGPRLHRKRAPDPELPIIDGGMRGVQANGRVANVRGDALSGELATVHTD